MVTRDEDPDPTTPESGTTSGAPARRPILVVDDDPLTLAFVARALRLDGYSVVAASSGREALRALYGGTATPSLLLTDVAMPGMTGIELAARLRADRPGVPIVLMSGDPATREGAERRPDLVRAVLLKPFDVDELLAVVHEIVGGRTEPGRAGG